VRFIVVWIDWKAVRSSRRTPTEVAAAAVGPNTAFVLNPGGNLYEHVGTNPDAGCSYLSGGVAQSSVGRYSYGQNAVYMVLTNGRLYEITSKGRYFLTSRVSQISASQFQNNAVFALMNNGALYAINGTGGTPLRYLSGGVAQISAGRDTSGFASVFALFNNNILEKDTSTGWHYIVNGNLMGWAREISASQFQPNTAFVLNSSEGILEYSGSAPLTDFVYLSRSLGANQICAGGDPYGSASVYYLASGTLYEITSANCSYFVAANVSILDRGSAVQYQTDAISLPSGIRLRQLEISRTVRETPCSARRQVPLP
jgi:hypothetical protein